MTNTQIPFTYTSNDLGNFLIIVSILFLLFYLYKLRKK